MLYKLNGTYVIYHHQKLSGWGTTTTVYDTNLTFQKQVPSNEGLKNNNILCFSIKSYTIALLGKHNNRLDIIRRWE